MAYLVCASAESKTQDAYAYANGDVARFGSAIASNTDELNREIVEELKKQMEVFADFKKIAIRFGIRPV